MAKPTPALTLSIRSLTTAQKALEKVLIAYGASGVVVKEGPDTRTDLEEVTAQLTELQSLAGNLQDGITNLVYCLNTTRANSAPAAVTEAPAEEEEEEEDQEAEVSSVVRPLMRV